MTKAKAKIAIIGSAPSSVALAPYADQSWTIWACSPGARPHVTRCNAWFEMHKWEPEKSWFSPEYVKFMAGLAVPVFTLHPIAEIPASVAYPKNDIMREFGAEAVYFYTSSIAWMLALAIMHEPSEISLYGVDMSAGEEIYSHQRAGCQYFIGQARKRGIKVSVPVQSDLDRPTPLYGYCELEPMHAKLLVRKEELTNRVNIATNNFKAAEHEMLYLRGALEDVNYTLSTWVADPLAIELTEWHAQPAIEAVTAESAPAPVTAVAPAQELATDQQVEQLREAGTKMRAQIVDGNLVTSWASTVAPEYLAGAGQ